MLTITVFKLRIEEEIRPHDVKGKHYFSTGNLDENSVKHLISCQDVLTKSTMQTFELALLSRKNYTPLTWPALVYTKNCCLCLLISFHIRGNIDQNRKIVLDDSPRGFVPTDKASNRVNHVDIYSQHAEMILCTGRETKFNLFKTYYNYQ